MKNPFFIGLLFLAFTFSSCNNDDDETSEPTNAELIVGKWYVESISSSTESLSACVKQSYFEFFDNSTLAALSFGFNSSDECVPLNSISGTYDFTSGNELILTTPAITQIVTIVVLTDEKLIFSNVDSGSGETVFTTLIK